MSNILLNVILAVKRLLGIRFKNVCSVRKNLQLMDRMYTEGSTIQRKTINVLCECDMYTEDVVDVS